MWHAGFPRALAGPWQVGHLRGTASVGTIGRIQEQFERDLNLDSPILDCYWVGLFRL